MTGGSNHVLQQTAHARGGFQDTSSHSRITNAFSDIGRPRSCSLARFGTIRLRAQAEVRSKRRPDTPTLVALADVTYAPISRTRTYLGVSDRRALARIMHSRGQGRCWEGSKRFD
jgi:hypothetical protein